MSRQQHGKLYTTGDNTRVTGVILAPVQSISARKLESHGFAKIRIAERIR